jgi:hypothetical protein
MSRAFSAPQAVADDRARRTAMDRNTGISNRTPPEDEQQDRAISPPRLETPPTARDAAGSEGEASPDLRADQTSHKAGSRSIAQKETRARYTDRSAPSTHKVAGAFGKEPKDEPD